MVLKARSIPGTGILRPQPNVFESEDKKTIVVITNWGSANVTEMVYEKVQSLLAPEFVDSDATQFQVMPEKIVKPMDAKLTEALQSVNAEIYKGENERKWKTVLEVVALHLEGETLYWSQAGLPHIMISPPSNVGGSVEFLSVVADPSAIFNLPVPLPMLGLGLDAYPNIGSGSVAVRSGTHLALLSIPGKALPTMTQSSCTVDDFCQVFGSAFPNQPGWVAVVEI